MPTRCDLRLEPDLDRATFTGEATVTVTVKEPVAELERLGLVREGVLRDHVFIDGQPRDVVLYGLLESDWQRIKPGLYARFGEPEATRYSEEDVC